LFSKPANLLVLDEPTNDLDIETLELLEEILLTFDGSVLLVSHDRDFMDNVVTSLLVLEGDGVVTEQAGGYSDWEARGGKLRTGQAEQDTAKSDAVEQSPAPDASAAKKSKLSYKLQRELDGLPAVIEKLEQRQQALESAMAKDDFYQQDHAKVQKALDELAAVQGEMETTFERWSAIEDGDA
jgi:ATP-binding cassette subfamily F protein uup